MLVVIPAYPGKPLPWRHNEISRGNIDKISGDDIVGIIQRGQRPNGFINIHGVSLFTPGRTAHKLLQPAQGIQVGGKILDGLKGIPQGKRRAFKDQPVPGHQIVYAHIQRLIIGIAAHRRKDHDQNNIAGNQPEEHAPHAGLCLGGCSHFLLHQPSFFQV